MYVVREMERGDAAAVLRLATAFSEESGVAAPTLAPADLAREALRAPPLFTVLVAEPHAGGAPVGYLLLTYAFELHSGAPGGRMEDLYVAPRVRQRGVGRGLMAAATRRVLAIGGRWLEWRAADGPAAMAFYRSVGARQAQGRVLYLGPAETQGLARTLDPARVSIL